MFFSRAIQIILRDLQNNFQNPNKYWGFRKHLEKLICKCQLIQLMDAKYMMQKHQKKILHCETIHLFLNGDKDNFSDTDL